MTTPTNLKAGELRIGNLVQISDGQHVKVWQLGDASEDDFIAAESESNLFSISGIDKFYGILLTQDILNKVGWRYHNHTYTWSLLNIDIDVRVDGLYFRNREIRFLHQLQNLYFALTGTELEIHL